MYKKYFDITYYKMAEIYKRLKLDGRNTNYKVSNLGNVWNTKKDFILKQGLRNRYKSVVLSVRKIKEKHSVHRLVAMVFLPNPENKDIVDHIDGVRINNNLTNLRWATQSENQMNAGLSRRNTSGVKGVSWCSRYSKWRVCIFVNGTNTFLGHYDNLDDARKRRIEKAQEYFGEFTHMIEKA